jgi:hypothetical protein
MRLTRGLSPPTASYTTSGDSTLPATGVAEVELLRLIDLGRLPGYLINNHVMISKTELGRFLETLDSQV